MFVALLLCVPCFDDPAKAPAPRSLFNGKDATEWSLVARAGSGKLTAADGCLKLGAGSPMTCCKIADGKNFPAANYELSFEARRDEGSDLFVCMTFPVGTEQASLVMGGWGGRTCGFSSVNGADASENETNTQRIFENGKWYKVKLRVEGRKLTAWLDGQPLVEFDAKDAALSTRLEVDECKPLGFATYRTAASYRKLELRVLPAGK